MTKIGSKTIDGENKVNVNEVQKVEVEPSNTMPGNPANSIPQLESYSTAIKGDKGDTGDDGVGISSITLTSTSGLVDTYTITYTDTTTKTFTVTNGDNGTEIELQKGTSYIQWRYVGDVNWKNLVALTDITGPKGDPPDMRTNGDILEYSKDGGTSWSPLYDLSTLEGATGNGISSIAWLSNSDGLSQGAAGTTDTYRITYTDTSTKDFIVTNGADGTNGDDGITYEWLTDTVDPTTEGDNGDMYLNTTSGEVFKKIAGTWTSQISTIIGTNGIDGSNGYALISLNTTATIDDTLFQNNVGRAAMDGDAILNTNSENNILHVREAGVWVNKGTVNGSNGLDGDAGIDGIDGDQWHYGTNGPSTDVGTTIQTYDEYYVNTATNQVSYKAEGASTWDPIFTLNGDVYKASITKSIDLSTLSIGGTLSITKAGLAYSAGQYITVANSSTNYIIGRVDSYVSDVISLTILDITGTISASSWTLNLSAKPNLNETRNGATYEIFLPAADGSVSGRIGDVSAVIPDGWTLSNSSGDLVISHDVVDGDGDSRPVFVAEIMYLRTTDSKWVTLKGTAAFSDLLNDLIAGEAQLNSLTTSQKDIKIHLIFY